MIKTNKMHEVIIAIIGIVCVYIASIIYKETSKSNRVKRIKALKDEETRFIIEKKVMRDLNYCEEYWNRNGSFNRQQYINYLESE